MKQGSHKRINLDNLCCQNGSGMLLYCKFYVKYFVGLYTVFLDPLLHIKQS